MSGWEGKERKHNGRKDRRCGCHYISLNVIGRKREGEKGGRGSTGDWKGGRGKGGDEKKKTRVSCLLSLFFLLNSNLKIHIETIKQL